MIIATLNTGSFEFTAAGNSQAEARQLLHLGWNRHVEQTGATATWLELADDVNIREVNVGDVFRDDRLIYNRRGRFGL